MIIRQIVCIVKYLVTTLNNKTTKENKSITTDVLSEIELREQKYNSIMNAVNDMAAFYRSNPHRLCADYLNIRLKDFQKIILFEMVHNNFTMYIASRGQGKTFLIAIFCVVMCILYPGIQIVVVSKTKQQALEIMTKIESDLLKRYGWGSENLQSEISSISSNMAKPQITWNCGSLISFAVANDNSRHFRANIVIVDEFVKVKLSIINDVIKKFMTVSRQAGFLNNDEHPEYKKYKDSNKEVYASSAWLKSHWSFAKMKSYIANMLDNMPFFVCDLPYQMSIYEDLLDKEQIEMEMSESTFDSLTFSIEMEGKWLGNNQDSFFKYEDLRKRCLIKKGYPTYNIIKNDMRKINSIPKLAPNERRILSVDVALMASKSRNNDATAFMLNSAVASSNNVYHANIVMAETHEGLITDELGLLIMRYYYLYNCTDIVVDGRNFGISVLDFMMKEQYDSDLDVHYDALTVINNNDIADRCHVDDAIPAIWVIQGSQTLNTKMNLLLRSGFKNNNITLLYNRYDGEDYLKENMKGYMSLPEKEKLDYLMPYIETDLLLNELMNLDVEIKGSDVKLTEKAGMRKDRYSSLSYNYYIMKKELEPLLKPERDYSNDHKAFRFRKPRYLQ